MRHAQDPYRALGVARGASEAEIKAAHRRLAKRYHPDSEAGDTDRFLAVQEAYKLLLDPLRRREWDARHAPGPVRASERGQARPRAANGRWTKAEQASPPQAEPEQAAAPGRDPASRTYTWSASEVPWWEEGAARDGRRQARRRQPAPAGSQGGAEDAPGAPPGMHTTQDFEVYNRSSGAAWSMAARAYFRRGEADLPRRGSFRQQGGAQPLTAARARAAAEEEARAAAGAGAAWAAPAAPAGAGMGAPAGARPSETASRWAGAARPADAQPPGRRPPASGVVHEAGQIHEVRAAARRQALASRWPSLSQRLLYAFLAWLPLALLVSYGGSLVTGCERASVACPPELAFVQTGITLGALGLLLALPRLAYALTVATAGVLLTGVALVVGIWFLGLRPPLPPSLLALSSVFLLVVHLALASWVLSRGAGRPWAPRRVSRGGGR
ncbi:MAG TPA: J domain-containing protein [Candidatus Limnocylindria bacterium]|nr:J domain-containing protein [Candidatus Limnocylindria bacterium]